MVAGGELAQARAHRRLVPLARARRTHGDRPPTRQRAMSCASVTAWRRRHRRAGSCRSPCVLTRCRTGGTPASAWRAGSRGGPRRTTARVADADEQQHEPDQLATAVVEHRVEREREADRDEDHALAQVGPRGAAAQLAAPARTSGAALRGMHADAAADGGDRLHRLGGRHDALLGELQHRLVLHARLADLVPDDAARRSAAA